MESLPLSPQRNKPLAVLCLVVIGAVLIWSGIAPKERMTWFLEVLPVMIGVPLVMLVREPFSLSKLLIVLLTLHALVLMVGGRYTYAEVPAGFWFQDWLGWERNPYDRLGHLFQGFVPALLTREILLRTSSLRPGKWLFFLCFCVALAFSAFYEILEWQAAIWTAQGAESFLGTQGDVWDTQWDMFLAAVGALLSLATLSGLQDRQLQG